jgi:hypothetical protein
MAVRKKYFCFNNCIIICIFTYAKEYMCIVSLAPSVAKALYEFGVEPCVKGITVFCPKGSIKRNYRDAFRA